MKTTTNSYKQILKATSLFGGIQVITILVSIIKTKVAALLIGVAGIGIFGILTSTINFIEAFTRLGLDITLVKEIASSKKNEKDQSVLIGTSIKLALITGILGLIIVVMFSPILSVLAFSNKTYTSFFVIVSFAVLFNQMAVGNLAVLQGLKSLRQLGKVISFSSILSLMPTIALYYFFGIQAIPWVICSTAFFTFLVSRYFRKQLVKNASRPPIKSILFVGSSLLKPGIYLGLASLSALAVWYCG